VAQRQNLWTTSFWQKENLFMEGGRRGSWQYCFFIEIYFGNQNYSLGNSSILIHFSMTLKLFSSNCQSWNHKLLRCKPSRNLIVSYLSKIFPDQIFRYKILKAMLKWVDICLISTYLIEKAQQRAIRFNSYWILAILDYDYKSWLDYLRSKLCIGWRW